MAFHIPNPCPKQLKDLKDTVDGKFCDQCSHHVHDFRSVSKDKILEIIDSEEKVCGIFTNAQLAQANESFWLKKLVAALLLVGGITLSDAQSIENLFKLDGVNVEFHHDTIHKDSLTDIVLLGGVKRDYSKSKPLCFIDGNKSCVEEFKSLNPKSVKNIAVLQPVQAVALHGMSGKNGAIYVYTKKKKR